MATNKRYEIDTLEKLINVINPENIDRISVDFLIWLNLVAKYNAELRKDNPEQTKDKTNYEISKPTFVWIDDGKNDIKSINIKNTKTGEITNIDVK